mmetsp:Transcript_16184/g.47183  ORF Transcript_16184/g.47183 Transcript_16184/m.47183 type:complete len:236 (+) Transcript_16184:380-1087(+)
MRMYSASEVLNGDVFARSRMPFLTVKPLPRLTPSGGPGGGGCNRSRSRLMAATVVRWACGWRSCSPSASVARCSWVASANSRMDTTRCMSAPSLDESDEPVGRGLMMSGSCSHAPGLRPPLACARTGLWATAPAPPVAQVRASWRYVQAACLMAMEMVRPSLPRMKCTHAVQTRKRLTPVHSMRPCSPTTWRSLSPATGPMDWPKRSALPAMPCMTPCCMGTWLKSAESDGTARP